MKLQIYLFAFVLIGLGIIIGMFTRGIYEIINVWDKQTICTQSEEHQQITTRLDSIDKKIDGVGMECADINMNLQQ